MCQRCYDDLDVDELMKNDEFKHLKTVDCYCHDICDQCFDEHAKSCPKYLQNKKRKEDEEKKMEYRMKLRSGAKRVKINSSPITT